MKILKNVLIFFVAAALLFGINSVTAPVIAEKEASSQFASLISVLPGASDFEELSLDNMPETVTAVYSEKNGLGYVVCLSTTQGYTGEPIEFALGVNADGTVAGSEITAYPDTKDFGEDFPLTFVGKDSALEGVELVSGATYSSSAFKNAVSDGLSCLISEGLIQEGVKSDDQLLLELVASVLPGMANSQGILQYEGEELMTALNGSCAAAITSDGSSSYLVVTNTAGDVLVYDAEGNDVTASAADSVKAAVNGASLSGTGAEDEKKITSLSEEGSEIEMLSVHGVYGCVTSAFKISSGDSIFYGFGTRPYGYANEVMPVYFILDENGAIVKINAPEFILHGEYFSSYELDQASYKEGFVGLDSGSFTEDTAVISGATMSSDAVKSAVYAVFEAFNQLKEA